ncbi:helix-turn-helix transcriptional regulator [Enterobacter cloacae complex sp. I2]|uniref:helix-turn-helix transcriptional regulator n=1 Tax=Enterobacter cloacae complex sp. I2 TaxID=2779603 RepID=UPI001866444F|nr:helix-turn-helix transcriptional regulator [Enterobacter cloacae complex sp. I2]MBE3510104.1 helix-turn-helix transcriptional regulator [Enterobacter cloacae complex sp. I2]
MLNSSKKIHQSVVKDLKKYIADNIAHKKITAHEICRLSGYSSFYMHRIFKQHTGKSLLQYINDLRMEKIEYELIHTSKKITEIAMDYGYQNLNELTKRFTKKYGTPPSNFRKTHSVDITSSDSADSSFPLRHRSPGDRAD